MSTTYTTVVIGEKPPVRQVAEFPCSVELRREGRREWLTMRGKFFDCVRGVWGAREQYPDVKVTWLEHDDLEAAAVCLERELPFPVVRPTHVAYPAGVYFEGLEVSINASQSAHTITTDACFVAR